MFVGGGGGRGNYPSTYVKRFIMGEWPRKCYSKFYDNGVGGQGLGTTSLTFILGLVVGGVT